MKINFNQIKKSLLLLFFLSLVACGPSEEEIRAEIETNLRAEAALAAEKLRVEAELAAEKLRVEAEQKALAAKPDISDNCTVNGFGKVSCSFSNSGTGKGTACYTVSFVRQYDKVYYLNSWGKPGVGEILTSSGEICSGIVEPEDVVDRQKSLTFIDEGGSGSAREPSHFCQMTRGPYSSERGYTGERWGAWHEGCVFLTEKVSK